MRKQAACWLHARPVHRSTGAPGVVFPHRRRPGSPSWPDAPPSRGTGRPCGARGDVEAPLLLPDGVASPDLAEQTHREPDERVRVHELICDHDRRARLLAGARSTVHVAVALEVDDRIAPSKQLVRRRLAALRRGQGGARYRMARSLPGPEAPWWDSDAELAADLRESHVRDAELPRNLVDGLGPHLLLQGLACQESAR